MQSIFLNTVNTTKIEIYGLSSIIAYKKSSRQGRRTQGDTPLIKVTMTQVL